MQSMKKAKFEHKNSLNQKHLNEQDLRHRKKKTYLLSLLKQMCFSCIHNPKTSPPESFLLERSIEPREKTTKISDSSS